MTKKTICKAGNVVCLKNSSVKYRFFTVNISKLTAPPGQILKVYRSDHPTVELINLKRQSHFLYFFLTNGTHLPQASKVQYRSIIVQ